LRHAKSFGLETAQCDADDPTNCGYLRFVHARIRSNSYLRGGGRNRPKSHGKQRAAVHDSSNVDEHEMSHNSDEEELEDVDNDCDEGHSGGVGDDDEEEEEEEEEEEDGPVERSELVEVDSNGDPLHTQTDRKVLPKSFLARVRSIVCRSTIHYSIASLGWSLVLTPKKSSKLSSVSKQDVENLGRAQLPMKSCKKQSKHLRC